ncbi:MAG: ribonuclease Z [Bacteroidales bacterium]|nr:ribonuclease Z [Bacteroidales bacterium]
MTFSLMVLGSSAAVPTSNRNLSAHLLNADGRFFLIDCGEGTQFQIHKYHVSWQRIHHVFISHLHGDHYFGLIGLLNTMHLLGRKKELHLYAPLLLREMLELQFLASQTTLSYSLVFHPLNMLAYDTLLDEGHISVYSFPLKHSIPTCGFLFREKKTPRKVPFPRSYAYCSDTAMSMQIVPWIKKVGLLYHETTFMQNMEKAAEEKFHSTSIQAATIAQKAQVKKMIIGHFSARYEDLSPMLDEARSVFQETFLAEEGIFIEI